MRDRSLPLAICLALGFSTSALAHGVQIEHQMTQAIEINAAFDSGEPMANAQVIVYAPDDPATPWLTGNTDEQGRFIFTPDPTKPGTWEVAVRQAGHGDILSIPIAGEATAATDPTTDPTASPTGETAGDPTTAQGTASSTLSNRGHELTPLQKAMMGGAVIWGFIGTALFFARGKK